MRLLDQISDAPSRQNISPYLETDLPRPAGEGLKQYLRKESGRSDREISPLTTGNDGRAFYRVPWKRGTAVAAVFQKPDEGVFHAFLKLSHLFAAAGLPVPRILDADEPSGVVVLEDLGDQTLPRFYERASEEETQAYQERALRLLNDIQAITAGPSCESYLGDHLALDQTRLLAELNLCERDWGRLTNETVGKQIAEELREEIKDVVEEIALRPRALCHGNCHAANFIVDRQGALRMVGFEGAFLGPASYDLVSLLLERSAHPPSHAVMRFWRLFFLEDRSRRQLSTIDPDEFAREFHLVTIRHGLRALGRHAQAASLCRSNGQGLIKPTLTLVSQAAERLKRYPALRFTMKKLLAGGDALLLDKEYATVQ